MKLKISQIMLRGLTLIIVLVLIESCSNEKSQEYKEMDNTLKAQLVSSTKDFFRFLEEKDMVQWIDLWADNSVMRNPYSTGKATEELIGKTAIFDVWKGHTALFDSMEFPIQEIIVDQESRTVVVRADGIGLMKNGFLYKNNYIFILHYSEDNKIKEGFSYFNPNLAAEAFGSLDKLEI